MNQGNPFTIELQMLRILNNVDYSGVLPSQIGFPTGNRGYVGNPVTEGISQENISAKNGQSAQKAELRFTVPRKSDSIAEKWGQTSVSFSREVGPAIAWPHRCTEAKTAFRKVTGRRSV